MEILWFRNDLRLHDNEALHAALQSGEQVLPVYVFDPRDFGNSYAGLAKTGAYRLRFLLDSLADLKTQLKQRGSDLVVLEGKPEAVIAQLCREFSATRVCYHREVTSEETVVEAALRKALSIDGVEPRAVWGSTLFHLDDLPLSIEEIPDVFTDFRKQTEKQCVVREQFTTPDSMPPLPVGAPSSEVGVSDAGAIFGVVPSHPSELGVLPFNGGERAGIRRLQEYFWERDRLRIYKKTRNGMLGADYSSKFSPWLARGCLSPRYIHAEVKRYERERARKTSTYWLIFELIWRDYFRFVAMKHGNRRLSLYGSHGTRIGWSRDTAAFAEWAGART